MFAVPVGDDTLLAADNSYSKLGQVCQLAAHTIQLQKQKMVQILPYIVMNSLFTGLIWSKVSILSV